MSGQLLFLSHIHEERDLAILIKNAIEAEFSGFVDVFVSSDGISIPAGANFLQRIEDALVNCIGAMYLISPLSVKRPWISFELGAVWIRSAMSKRAGQKEIPALPLCHSGMLPGTLPSPLGNLNAIAANQPTSLEFAFRSIQAAVGGKGNLRTDFHALAAQVVAFENDYTFGSDFKKILISIGLNPKNVAEHAKVYASNEFVTLVLDNIEQSAASALMSFLDTKVAGKSSYKVRTAGLGVGPKGAINMTSLDCQIKTDLILSSYDLLVN